MYPPPPTGPPQLPSHLGSDDEYDQYPLNERDFIERTPVMQSPFSDPYPVETHEPPMPTYDSQPLLQQNHPIMPTAMPLPYANNRYSTPTSPPPNQDVFNDNNKFNTEGTTPPYFTGAPRRQPRRYKTSKYSLHVLFVSVCRSSWY